MSENSTTTHPLHFATIAAVGALLRAGETNSVALTQLMLERIAAHDGRLNAFITVTADLALEQAEAADRELAAGQDRGPLHGVPVAIKDLIATKGVRTTCGSKLFEDWVPAEDATVVTKLRDAGAVMLGKTGLHELAYGTTSINLFFGAISNPWALDHHPGGSSGGSASAVSAGLAYAALGTDTGCSVRQPAHCCGIVGLKPSFGLVSKAGVFPMVWTMDHVGPLTRSVEDAALLLDCLAGHDPADPYSAKREATGPFDPGEVSIAGRKIGVTRGFFFEGGDPEVVAVTEAALETWRGLGARLIDLDLPEVEEAFAAAGATFAEVLAVHEKDFEARPEAFSEEVRAKLGQRDTSPLAYVKAQHVRRRFVAAVERAMAEAEVEVLLAPTSTVTAAPIAAQPADHGLYCWRNTGIFDFTGQPSISVPCGFTAAGLPVGLMVTGRLFEDATLLRFAQAFEQASPWHLKTPPGF